MSPEQEFNILVVAQQREHIALIETSLEIMQEKFYVTGARSGVEAEMEFNLGTHYDMVITDYRVVGLSGVEVIEKARARLPGIKALILANGDDLDGVIQALNGRAVDAVLPKPLDARDFSTAVRTALFGRQETPEEASADAEPEAVRAGGGDLQASSDKIESEFGPIPLVELGAIQAILEPQLEALGARAIAFASREGEALLQTGHFDEDLRFSELLIFIARNLNNSATIATYIGPVPSTTMQYYDGTNYDIFAISVGVHFFVALVFPGDSQRQLGNVMRFRRNAIWAVIDIIGVEAAMGRSAEAVQAQRQELLAQDIEAELEEIAEETGEAPPDEEETPLGALAEARRRAALAEAERNKPRPDYEFDVFEFEDEEPAEQLSIDLEDLGILEEEALDLSDIGDDDFEDLDDFWATADDDLDISEDSISMEEAMEMGLFELDEDE